MYEKVDVICQHSIDGRIIPLRVRIKGEDGIPQAYTIKNWHEVTSFRNGYTLPSGIRIGGRNNEIKFECQAYVLNRLVTFYLIFSCIDLTWMLGY